MILTMEEIRENVVARIDALDDSIKPDILNADAEHDDLIRALDVLTAPVEKGAGDGTPSLGRKVLITSLRRDHRDDSDLGPHSHHAGWAVDMGTFDGIDVGNNPKTRRIIEELIAHNKYVTKVGVGGVPELANDPDLQALAAQHNTLLFEDNDQPHIHIQSA